MPNSNRFTGKTPNSPLYEYERAIGNILAQLHTIRQHTEVAMEHADKADLRYPEDSLNQIYIEMAQQLEKLREFREKLLKAQEEILAEIYRGREDSNVVPFKRVG